MRAVNIACSNQRVRTLTEGLADGLFKFVKKRDGTCMYRYEFTTRKGCKSVDVDLHGAFPVLTNDLLLPHELLQYRTNSVGGLGNLLTEGHGDKLEEVQLKIISTYVYEHGVNEQLTDENNVQDLMIKHLNENSSEGGLCTASLTSRTECKMSQFSGGGDIQIDLNDQKALVDQVGR